MGGARSGASAADMAFVREALAGAGGAAIPCNFVRTARGHDPKDPSMKRVFPCSLVQPLCAASHSSCRLPSTQLTLQMASVTGFGLCCSCCNNAVARGIPEHIIAGCC